jgi:hypothetical protein
MGEAFKKCGGVADEQFSLTPALSRWERENPQQRDLEFEARKDSGNYLH